MRRHRIQPRHLSAGQVAFTVLLLVMMVVPATHSHAQKRNGTAATSKQKLTSNVSGLQRQTEEKNQRALSLSERGDHAAAYRIWKDILPDAAKAYGRESRNYATHLFNLAVACNDLENYDEATQHYSAAQKVFERAAPEAPEFATLLNNFGLVCDRLKRRDDAIRLFERSLALRRKLYSPDDIRVAVAENHLGQSYAEANRFPEAELLFRQCLKSRDAKLGKSHPHSCCTRNNLAGVYVDTGRLDAASELYGESRTIAQATGNTSLLATALRGLARVAEDRGDFGTAESHYKRSRELNASLSDTSPIDLASDDSELAVLYLSHGLLDQAEMLFRQAIQVLEQHRPRSDDKLAQVLVDYASLHYKREQPDPAESCLKRAIPMLESTCGKSHPATARALSHLGVLYRDLRQLNEAEELLRRSYAINAERLGENHWNTISARFDLASIYVRQRRMSEAIPELKRCVIAREQLHGPQHRKVAEGREVLGQALAQAGENPQAAEQYDQSRRIAVQSAMQVLPFLPEADQLEFLQLTDRLSLDAQLSFSLRCGSDEYISRLGAEWLLNSKGISQETRAMSYSLGQASANPEVKQWKIRLASVRSQLSARELHTDQSGPDAHQTAALRAQEKEILAATPAAIRRAMRSTWIDLESLRRHMPDKSAFISISLVEIFDFDAAPTALRWLPRRYVAWIVPKVADARVSVVDLGDAASIDASVKLLQEVIKTSSEGLLQDPEVAERQMQDVTAQLARQILAPLRPQLDDADEWIISPDASLWLVPWAALPLDDSTLAIEKHQIRYTVSGRDLIPSAVPENFTPGRSAIIADPDFDFKPGSRSSASHGLALSAGLRSLADELAIGQISRLPGTRVEAEAIQDSLAAYASQAPELRTDGDAREEYVKTLRSPKVLVLATHGFALEDARPSHNQATSSVRHLAQDPLLRCGLLLASCNQASAAADPQGNDGVMTGLEVTGCAFRGSELIVLSACETGLGDVRSGEGVAGLRQAFQLAGAKTVVATLWQIPDQDSALLMAAFFKNLAVGQSKSQALRNAQLGRIAERRKQHGTAHPFFWAAWTLTGE